MNCPTDNFSDAKTRFWDRFIQFLSDQGIKDTIRRWYVIRIEDYIAVNIGKKLTQHNPDDVNSYLQKLGRDGRLKDWQFRQSVDAIRKLFEFTDVKMRHQIDWDFWFNSSQSLPEDHRTIARAVPYSQITKSFLKDDSGYLNELRRTYPDARKALISEIRRRAYSISTEQAYESWLFRFIAFHNGIDPNEMAGSHVVKFLEYLVLERNVSASTQSTALNALVFFYTHVIKIPLGELDDYTPQNGREDCQWYYQKAKCLHYLAQ